MLGDLDFFEAVLAPAIARPLGQLTIARRPCNVRLRGVLLVEVEDAIGFDAFLKARFEGALGGDGGRGEAKDRAWGLGIGAWCLGEEYRTYPKP